MEYLITRKRNRHESSQTAQGLAFKVVPWQSDGQLSQNDVGPAAEG